MSEKRGSFAGLYSAFIAKRNSSGYPVGQVADPETIANSTTMHAYHLFNPVEATAPTPNFEDASFKGGQKFLGTRPLGVGSVDPFDLTLTGMDEMFNQLIGGGFDDTIATEMGLSAPNTNKIVRAQLILGLTIGFDDEDGNHHFSTSLYPNVTIRPAYQAANQNAGENPNPLTFRVSPQMTTRTPLGLLVEDTALNLQDNKDFVFYLRSAKPISITTYKATAADSSFTLQYLPSYSDIGGATNVFVLNGAAAAANINTVSTSTGAVSIDAAYGNGDLYIATYQTEFATA